MSAQDKLGLGILAFLVFFVIAFLFVPREVYQAYFASLNSRGRRRLVSVLGTGVFALCIPYFYEVLVGYDNRNLAHGLQLLISVAAYGVLVDVALFTYKTYWRPAFGRRRRR